MLLLFLAGVLVAVCNAIAGGGTFLPFPFFSATAFSRRLPMSRTLLPHGINAPMTIAVAGDGMGMPLVRIVPGIWLRILVIMIGIFLGGYYFIKY